MYYFINTQPWPDTVGYWHKRKESTLSPGGICLLIPTEDISSSGLVLDFFCTTAYNADTGSSEFSARVKIYVRQTGQ